MTLSEVGGWTATESNVKMWKDGERSRFPAHTQDRSRPIARFRHCALGHIQLGGAQRSSHGAESRSP
jgi:hypothetical protein